MLGPCSHWSRQPDLLARTRPFSPRSASFAFRAFCNSAWPAGSQHPRGLDASRTLVQTKMWRSNLLMLGSVYQLAIAGIAVISVIAEIEYGVYGDSGDVVGLGGGGTR